MRLITDPHDYENKDDLQVQLKIPSPSFKAMLDHLASAEPPNIPNKIDYRKKPNPYESQYGPDLRIEVKKSSLLRCYACVSDTIEHMVSERKKVFKGINHRNYFIFYHEYLLFMTSKETSKWMKEKEHEEMWILPEIDIFASDPVLKRYRGRPPGNSPELCNIDSCIKKKLQREVDFHVRYTHSFHKLYLKKFSIETPKKRTSKYLQIVDPIYGVNPLIKCIISDTYDILTKIMYIMEAKG